MNFLCSIELIVIAIVSKYLCSAQPMFKRTRLGRQDTGSVHVEHGQYRPAETACTIATSLVHSKLDYCNSLFYRNNPSQIKPPQTIQNALARAVTKIPKHHYITPV